MSEHFPYEELTWQEVEALPRDCPLVIPLGEGYPVERLSSALGDPPQFGLLPIIPYGWRGSGYHINSVYRALTILSDYSIIFPSLRNRWVLDKRFSFEIASLLSTFLSVPPQPRFALPGQNAAIPADRNVKSQRAN